MANQSDSKRCLLGENLDLHLSRGAAVAFLTLGGFGFISNVFIDYVIYRLRLYRVLGHVLILSLSISGIIQSLFVSIFNSIELLTDSGFPVTQGWCRYTAGVSLMAILSTCQNLVGISIDRFIAIFFPLHYPQIVTPKRVYTYLLLMWSFMITWAFLPFFGWNSGATCLRAGFSICDWGNTLDYDYFIATSIIVLTTVIIVIILQTAIYMLAIKQARKLYSKDNCQAATGRTELSRVQKKVSRIVAFIVLTFFITYTPWFALSIRTVVTSIGGQKVIMACSFLLYTNAMLNPWVYATSDRNIRTEVLSVLKLPGGRNTQVVPAWTSNEERSEPKQHSKSTLDK